MAHVREAIAAIEPNDSVERFTGLGVTVLAGVARFADARTVQRRRAPRSARAASSSRPARGPRFRRSRTSIAVPYLTNETIFELKRLPAHLVVIGGGPIGLEMAQAFRRLGSEVTVLEAETALAKDDPELTALLVETLRAEGIDIREGAKVVRVARRGRSGVRVTLERPGRQRSRRSTGRIFSSPPGGAPISTSSSSRRRGVRFDDEGHQGERAAADPQPPRLCDRRRRRRRAVHALGRLPGAASSCAPSSSASAARCGPTSCPG